LLDVVARVDSRLAHVVIGLHAPGSEVRMLRGTDEGVLGEFVDESGEALAVDALSDVDLAPLVLVTLVGEEVGTVSVAADDDRAFVLDAGDRFSFSVFPWLAEGSHPGVDMLVSLDEVGFNHLAAPIALWRRKGRDLGLVQELLTEATDGWAVARTSLRDLYYSRVAPEEAGGDFADEARSLGIMTARLHLACDRAFGRRSGAVADWGSEVELGLGRLASARAAASLEEAVNGLRASPVRATMLRTHGDLHLGRTARTNHGWVVADWLPGGVDASGDAHFRSPLYDAASMLWSLRQVATGALDERDQALRPGLEVSAEAWVARNRRAFLTSYLATPGIAALVPADAALVEWVVAVFELEAAARAGPGPAG
jgi:maltokinase